MRIQSTFLASSLVAVALFGAGCGDDEDEPTTTTTSGATGATGEAGATDGELPADVVAEANEICAQGNEELARAFGELEQAANPNEIQEIVTDEVVPNIQNQIDDIRELDESEELQSALDEADGVLDEIEGDPTVLTESQSDPFEDVNDELNELGLRACAG